MSSSSNPPGAFDTPPPYQETKSKPPAKNAESDNTVQLNIDHGLENSAQLLTTITLTLSTSFEDFQRQVKQKYIESTHSAGYGSFIWTTWLHGGSGQNGEFDDRESVDAFTWETMRERIVRLAAANALGWKGRPCKLEAVFRRVVLGKQLKAKNAQQLQRMLRLHEQNEMSLLLGGRHVPSPCLKQDECVLM